MKKNLFKFLFGESQVDDELASLVEDIADAEVDGDLKVEKAPLAKALSSIGIEAKSLESDPRGLALVFSDGDEFRAAHAVLNEPDSLHKLAELGWVYSLVGDVAQINEPAEWRIRFLEISTSEPANETPSPASHKTRVARVSAVMKKAREFATTPLDRDDDDLNPVDNESGEVEGGKEEGVGKAKDGEKRKGKVKGVSEGYSIHRISREEALAAIQANHLQPVSWANDVDPAQALQSATVFEISDEQPPRVFVRIHDPRGPKGPYKGWAEYGAVRESYDDFGDGKYDHMGRDKRFPLHVEKAKEFLAHGDKFNAGSHARAALMIGAKGYRGTNLYLEAQNILREIGDGVPDDPNDPSNNDRNRPRGPRGFGEAGHKAGCQCGFCKNKGRLPGKGRNVKDGNDDPEADEEDEKVFRKSRSDSPAGEEVRKHLGMSGGSSDKVEHTFEGLGNTPEEIVSALIEGNPGTPPGIMGHKSYPGMKLSSSDRAFKPAKGMVQSHPENSIVSKQAKRKVK
jgi:hypothetical protein